MERWSLLMNDEDSSASDGLSQRGESKTSVSGSGSPESNARKTIADFSVCIHSGWLTKRGAHRLSRSRRRWFVLHESALIYFRKSGRTKGAIPIGNGTRLQRAGSSLVLITPGSRRNWQLTADSEDDCSNWVMALQGCCCGAIVGTDEKSSSGWEIAGGSEHNLVVLLLGAQGIPKLDYFGHCDPYVKMQAYRMGSRVGDAVKWSVQNNTDSPIWNSARDLGCKCSDADLVEVTIWDKERIGKDFIASSNIPLSALPLGSPDEAVMMEWSLEACKGRPVNLRLCALPPPRSHRKRVFFIRHAESQYNSAQAQSQYYAMLGQTNHPLSEEGLRQAKALEEKLEASLESMRAGTLSNEEEESLLRCKGFWVSPLMRAVQTALIGCAPLLGDAVVHLRKHARERLNIGGYDSMGEAIGGDAWHREMRNSIVELCGGADAAARYVDAVRFNMREVDARWWSTRPESRRDLINRLGEIMSQILHSPLTDLVLVTHSHFFRDLLCRYMSSSAEVRGANAKDLRKRKLCNCGVAAVDIDFGRPRKELITRVSLMLGSTLEGLYAEPEEQFSEEEAAPEESPIASSSFSVHHEAYEEIRSIQV